MRFSKLIAMLESRSLRLSRGDQFADQFEGSLSHPTATRVAENWAESDLPIEMQAFSHHKLGREFVEISCWYGADRENALVWDSYGGREAVAISTTVAQLRRTTHKSLIADPHIHRHGIYRVEYIDYATDEMDLNKSPFLYKKIEFQGEHEIRLLRESWGPSVRFPPGSEPIVAPHPPSFPSAGEDLRLKDFNFINEIRVSPLSSSWFFQLVEKVCSRFHVRAKIQRSQITAGEPSF